MACPTCGGPAPPRRAYCSDACAIFAFCRRHRLGRSLPHAARAVADRVALRRARRERMRALNATRRRSPAGRP